MKLFYLFLDGVWDNIENPECDQLMEIIELSFHSREDVLDTLFNNSLSDIEISDDEDEDEPILRLDNGNIIQFNDFMQVNI